MSSDCNRLWLTRGANRVIVNTVSNMRLSDRIAKSVKFLLCVTNGRDYDGDQNLHVFSYVNFVERKVRAQPHTHIVTVDRKFEPRQARVRIISGMKVISR